ncbi:hypothetical protein KFE25_013877 [Diacronema lutheri]|uniref:Uncharacterized protein n=2 Tax=Diacronema lutheri TaxID=2081491 RepID=A0A8J6CBU8_DIALT|nr:hypothetical protein KFE25_013877 [Diacronema lutheri]
MAHHRLLAACVVLCGTLALSSAAKEEECTPPTVAQINQKVAAFLQKLESIEHEPPMRRSIMNHAVCSKLNPKEKFGPGKGKGRGGGKGQKDDGPNVCMDKDAIGAAVAACAQPDAASSCSGDMSTLRSEMGKLCAALTELECTPAFCSSLTVSGEATATPTPTSTVMSSSHSRHGRGQHLQAASQPLRLIDSSRVAEARAGATVALAVCAGLVVLGLALVRMRRSPRDDSLPLA